MQRTRAVRVTYGEENDVVIRSWVERGEAQSVEVAEVRTPDVGQPVGDTHGNTSPLVILPCQW